MFLEKKVGPNEDYSIKELDAELQKAMDAYEENGRYYNVYFKDYEDGDHKKLEKYLTKFRYLKALGYVEVEEMRNDTRTLMQFSARITDDGIRLLADGGLSGKYKKEASEKQKLKRNQQITWGIAIMAIVASLGSVFASLYHKNNPTNTATVNVDTVIIKKSLATDTSK